MDYHNAHRWADANVNVARQRPLSASIFGERMDINFRRLSSRTTRNFGIRFRIELQFFGYTVRLLHNVKPDCVKECCLHAK